MYIDQVCRGFIVMNGTNSTSKSGHAQAIVTFEDLELALAAFERLQWCKCDHGEGQMLLVFCQAVQRPWQASLGAGPCTVAFIERAMC